MALARTCLLLLGTVVLAQESDLLMQVAPWKTYVPPADYDPPCAAAGCGWQKMKRFTDKDDMRAMGMPELRKLVSDREQEVEDLKQEKENDKKSQEDDLKKLNKELDDLKNADKKMRKEALDASEKSRQDRLDAQDEVDDLTEDRADTAEELSDERKAITNLRATVASNMMLMDSCKGCAGFLDVSSGSLHSALRSVSVKRRKAEAPNNDEEQAKLIHKVANLEVERQALQTDIYKAETMHGWEVKRIEDRMKVLMIKMKGQKAKATQYEHKDKLREKSLDRQQAAAKRYADAIDDQLKRAKEDYKKLKEQNEKLEEAMKKCNCGSR
eukprot:gnl/TRDRNA2_/TRDRNA2_182333_c0_seq1.p1 gnl/TRDRNA2_/TRDRNA2_182333_c0~~gnl/TRDRNA2_/TRDRNA2_182333_c0_seq1.p1  ORF type:complete len:327 (-),score=119.40 gnl/TRDRNA2_/TRDRNA2_182333_c0_seq1:85-1065(-)